MAKHPHLADTQGLFDPMPPALSTATAPVTPAVHGAEGHRARMRDRLLVRFRSFAGCIAAAPQELREIEGLGDAGIAALKTIQAAALRLMRAEVIGQPILSSWQHLMEYLTAVLARERIEHFRVLYLDTRNRLIADEPQGRGTVNATPVYPRELVRRALELHATALILVHNHPSGDPTPSQQDIQMTRAIRTAAEPLSVTLHDHVIIGNARWVSLRQEGLI
jgi:DNA repair protein RadC